jgi:hypothetical protein
VSEVVSDTHDRWDQELADWLVGKYVLVGLTQVDRDGSVISRREIHGRVKSAKQGMAIILDRSGQKDDSDFRLPPDTAVFGPAEQGEYKLRTTGETVKNPDALATWTIGPSENRSFETS